MKMAQNQTWITAFITAYARAYHATHDSSKIFDDYLADDYYTPEEHASFDQNLAGMLDLIDPELAAGHPDQATALARVMQTLHEPVTLSRSRFCEDCLAEAIRQGARQYVILGAGFDTFAFRRPDLLARLRVFKLDHPMTQAMKRERIARVGWTIPPQLSFVPVDFTSESLAGKLTQSDFDTSLTSFLSWLGVTYYLPREVVFNTLGEIREISAPGSSIVFDYMDAEAFVPAGVARRTALMQNIARMAGEPMLSGFEPQALAMELRTRGLEVVEDFGPEAIEARYFHDRNDGLHAFEHVHVARAVRMSKTTRMARMGTNGAKF
jgi:methyltransferase (TIGR00027 family)